MRHMQLLKAVCEWYTHKQGRAVTTVDLRNSDPLISQWSQAKFYRIMNELITYNFVERTQRGLYVPLDIYQHELNI